MKIIHIYFKKWLVDGFLISACFLAFEKISMKNQRRKKETERKIRKERKRKMKRRKKSEENYSTNPHSLQKNGWWMDS